jgi:hypothetical protein
VSSAFDDDPKESRDAPSCPWPSRCPYGVDYRPVPGFPAYRVGADRSVWVNLTRPGLPPPWDVPKWRRMRPRGQTSRGATYDLRAGSVNVRRSGELLYRVAFELLPASAIAPAGDVPRRSQIATPSTPLPQSPTPPTGPVPPPELPPCALVPDVEYRPIPRFPGCRIGSDRTVWAGAFQEDQGTWRKVREYRRGSSAFVSIAQRGRPFSISVTVLWSVAFGPGTPGAGDIDYRPVPGYLDYLLGSDRTLWRRRATKGARRLGLARVLIPVKPRTSPDGVSSVWMVRNGRGTWFPMGDVMRSVFPPLMPTGFPSSAKGAENNRAVLDDVKVIEARRLKREGWTYPELAARYGVCRNTVSYAVTGKTWSHIPMETAPPSPAPG